MHMVNVKGHSVQKLEWKRTNGQTDGGDCITSRDKAVGKKAVLNTVANVLVYQQAVFSHLSMTGRKFWTI